MRCHMFLLAKPKFWVRIQHWACSIVKTFRESLSFIWISQTRGLISTVASTWYLHPKNLRLKIELYYFKIDLNTQIYWINYFIFNLFYLTFNLNQFLLKQTKHTLNKKVEREGRDSTVMWRKKRCPW